jgi:hypothetical protein
MRNLIWYLCACSLGVAQQPAQQAAPPPTFGTTVVIPSGLRGDIYLIHENTTVLPTFERRKLKSVGTIWTTTLNIPPRHWREGFPGVTRHIEWFAINYTGRFWIDKPGQYEFALLSDDGANLYIDDQLVIDNDCQHPPAVRAARVTLSGGVHRIRLPYFQGPRDCLALILAVAEADGRWRVFSTDEFKPPSNPETWQYDQTGHAVLALEVDDTPPKMTQLLRALGEDAEASAPGCIAYPIRDCGK